MERIEMRLCAEDALPPWARERPVFLRYRPGQAARYRLRAPYHGVLTQRGPCLGVVRDGRFSTVFWPETARIAFGAAGPEVSEPGRSPVRLGDTILFTGGPLPKGMAHGLGGDVLSAETPMACARYPGYDGWLAIVNPGFRRRQEPPELPVPGAKAKS
jgi:hypothetical protein